MELIVKVDARWDLGRQPALRPGSRSFRNYDQQRTRARSLYGQLYDVQSRHGIIFSRRAEPPTTTAIFTWLATVALIAVTRSKRGKNRDSRHEGSRQNMVRTLKSY